MKVLLATNNNGKVKELKHILTLLGKNFWVESLKDANIDVDIPETSSTLIGNARLKANGIYELIKNNNKYDFIISEDFGFFVHSFPNIAGVHAKRWHEGSDKDRSRAVVDLFKKNPTLDRSAEYISVFVAIDKAGKSFEVEGKLRGTVGSRVVDAGGFAYDQILVVKDGRYLSEYTLEEKNQISSRSVAAHKLINLIK
jgi:XTP/dITP diphosphohydrolase